MSDQELIQKAPVLRLLENSQFRSSVEDFFKVFKIKVMPQHINELHWFLTNFKYAYRDQERLLWHLYGYFLARSRRHVPYESFEKFLIQRGYRTPDNELGERSYWEVIHAFGSVQISNKIPLKLYRHYRRFRDGYWILFLLGVFGDWILLAEQWRWITARAKRWIIKVLGMEQCPRI